MNDKKKKIIMASIVGVVLLGIIGAIVFLSNGVNKNKGNVAEIQGKSVFYMYDKSSPDIYTLNENKEKTKLTSDAQFISYDDQLNAYLMVDKDNALYTIDDKGNKDKITSDAIIGKIRTGSENKIYFITKNSDLYLKEKDKEKDKISSNISNCLVADASLVFSDNENSLFMKKSGKDKIKLASNVMDVRFNSTLNNIAYVSEGALYLKDIEKDDKDKLADKNNSAPFEFVSDTALVYMEDYDSTNKKGELFYKELGKVKRKLASDVSSFNVFSDGIFYINSDKTLYFRDYKSDKNTKILDDATETIRSKGSIFALDKDKNLYKVNANREKEKLNQDVVKNEVTADSIASTNKEKELYIGNKKIASDVVDFRVNGKEIAYINNLNEVYIIKDGITSEKVIDNAKDYKKIQFNDYTLFTNTLGASDITGCWKLSDGSNNLAYIKFYEVNNFSEIAFNDFITTEQYKIENSTEDSMNINVDNTIIKIQKIDENTLKINDNNLKRVSEDEYNKSKNAIDKILPVVRNKFGNYKEFKGIKYFKDKLYYVYGYNYGDIGNASYFDENGDLYNGNPEFEVGDSGTTNGSSKGLEYKTYTNNRYGFSIDYPNNLTQDSPPQNGAGQSFKNADNSVVVSVSGSNNVFNETAKSLYDKQLSNLKVKPDYNVVKENYYVISWEQDGSVYYEYYSVGGNNGSIQGFEIKYPSNQKKNYEPMVDKIYKSFKPGDLSVPH